MNERVKKTNYVREKITQVSSKPSPQIPTSVFKKKKKKLKIFFTENKDQSPMWKPLFQSFWPKSTYLVCASVESVTKQVVGKEREKTEMVTTFKFLKI